MDVNWMTFGVAILGLLVTAVFIYRKDQQSS